MIQLISRFILSSFLLFAIVSGHFAQVPGPVDGADLPPTDLERVRVGDIAPDFRLPDQRGRVHTLSGYLGKKVVLVFYRGFW